MGLGSDRRPNRFEQKEAEADFIGRDQGAEDRKEPFLQQIQPTLGCRQQRGAFALAFEQRRGLFVLGQLLHVQPLLFGQTSLVKLNRQDQPDQSRCQELPDDRRDGEEGAPAT